jgi:hypothetical protein
MSRLATTHALAAGAQRRDTPYGCFLALGYRRQTHLDDDP